MKKKTNWAQRETRREFTSLHLSDFTRLILPVSLYLSECTCLTLLASVSLADSTRLSLPVCLSLLFSKHCAMRTFWLEVSWGNRLRYASPSDLMRCSVWLLVGRFLAADLIFGDLDDRPSGAPLHQVTPHCRDIGQSVTWRSRHERGMRSKVKTWFTHTHTHTRLHDFRGHYIELHDGVGL